MNTEERLMIILSKKYIGEEEQRELDSLICQFDQKAFFSEIILNKVGGLVLHNLKKLRRSYCLCSAYRQIIKYWYVSVRMKQKVYEKEIVQIIYLFEKNNIRYAILKGLHMVKQVYEEAPFVRDYNDIDILVERKSLDSVAILLNSLGFRQGSYMEKSRTIREFSREEKIKMCLFTHQVMGYTKVTRTGENCFIINMDINFSIFEGGLKKDRISTEALLEKREKYFLTPEVTYYSLNNQDTIVQLIYHIYKDINFQDKKNDLSDRALIKFVDLYEFIRMVLQNKKEIEKLTKYIFDNALVEETITVITILNELYNSEILKEILDFCLKSREAVI